MKYYLLIVTHVIAFSVGAFLVQPKTVEKIVVKEIEKPVYRYVKEVKKDDCDELFKAYQARINLSYTTKDSQIKVLATDGYKETTALWEIQTTPDYRVYFGIGAVCAVGGAYLAYKVFK